MSTERISIRLVADGGVVTSQLSGIIENVARAMNTLFRFYSKTISQKLRYEIKTESFEAPFGIDYSVNVLESKTVGAVAAAELSFFLLETTFLTFRLFKQNPSEKEFQEYVDDIKTKASEASGSFEFYMDTIDIKQLEKAVISAAGLLEKYAVHNDLQVGFGGQVIDISEMVRTLALGAKPKINDPDGVDPDDLDLFEIELIYPRYKGHGEWRCEIDGKQYQLIMPEKIIDDFQNRRLKIGDRKIAFLPKDKLLVDGILINNKLHVFELVDVEEFQGASELEHQPELSF